MVVVAASVPELVKTSVCISPILCGTTYGFDAINALVDAWRHDNLSYPAAMKLHYIGVSHVPNGKSPNVP